MLANFLKKKRATAAVLTTAARPRTVNSAPILTLRTHFGVHLKRYTVFAFMLYVYARYECLLWAKTLTSLLLQFITALHDTDSTHFTSFNRFHSNLVDLHKFAVSVPKNGKNHSN